MSAPTTSSRLVRSLAAEPVPWVAIVAIEAFTVLVHLALTPAAVTELRYLVYPFVWIDLGIFAVARVKVPDAGRRVHLFAGGLALAYFLAMAYITGLLGIYLGGPSHTHAPIHGLQVTMTAPGWGPRVAYVTHAFHLYFVPYRVVGYLALAYLLYAAVLDATATALSGVLGLVACVGCSFPLVTSLAAGLGGATGLLAATTGFAVDLSTAVFVVAVALLSWRPGGGA